MTAGFQWREFPDIYAWIQSRDWLRYVIELPLANNPGEKFSYGSIMTHLLSGILTKATGRSTYDFGKEHLFGPLGIRNFYWLRDPMGYYVGGFQMFFTARDIAKLGYLLLRNGVWEGKQVVSREWAAEASRLHVINNSYLRLGDYGYLWWIKTARGHHAFAAIGYGGQYIFVVPALSLVVVTTADDRDDIPTYHSQAITLLTKYVVEAVNPGQPEIAANGVVNSASYQPVIAPDSFMTIFGRNFAAVYEEWSSAISEGRLPTALGGVRVRIDNRECFLSYVSPAQVNVLVPAEVWTGHVPLELSNRDGTANATVAVARVSPALFTYALDEKQHAAALFAGEGVYVARTGALQNVSSRPARPGDNLELYATGLGATAQPHPVGEVLREVYPIADPASVRVFVGGSQALVQSVAMTFAGVYQVNIQVPQDILSGDLLVVVQVGERASQPDVVLTFER